MQVRKMNGTVVPYDPSKLERSLKNSGADYETIQKIMLRANKILYNGITTKELFRFVFTELKKYSRPTASRYNLRNAMLELGPEGYFFERFVARILEKQGYSVQVGKIVPGKYIEHEIDVVASKGNEKLMVECKHHMYPGLYCDIQTALYVYARFLEVKDKFDSAMLATNTKFSDQVLKYAEGVGLKLMGWKIPSGDSIESNIERFKLYPITVLNSIDKKDKGVLLKQGIIFVSDLSKNKKLDRMLGISNKKAEEIIEEARTLQIEHQ